MALYAIGDLHLSFDSGKPMDVFGGAWSGYIDKLISGLSLLREEDTLVVCGDLSWGMSLEQAFKDFAFISSFPSRKIIVKGNHDYWWTTAAKMERFFREKSLAGLALLHNNCHSYGDALLCGTRGWFFEEDARDGSHNRKIFNREVIRLEASLKAARQTGGGEKIVFLHYPPVYEGYVCREIVEVMKEYGVMRCFYGHLHGSAHGRAVTGLYEGIDYSLVSADYTGFKPVKIMD